VGDQVKLHWTTPSQTTDKLAIKGAVTAEICREAVLRNAASKTICSPVQRLTVTPGDSDAVDKLPGDLLAEPARLLAYRVQLLNKVGRTAGPSPAVYAASGPVPPALQGFAGEVSRAGVVLRWAPAAARKEQATAGFVELERTVVDAAAPAEAKGLGASLAAMGAARQPRVERMRADAGAGAPETAKPDAGGIIDRTVELGHTYRYIAQRVRRVAVGGQTLDLRSVPSAPLEFAVRDVFPPDVPHGLVAVPSMAGEGATGAAIDLSWEPDVEPRLAGYRVYRREAGSDWRPVGPALVPQAAYHDANLTAGRAYSYRITAVSTAGNESAPSAEASETAGP
jgi:hypothetical protein